MNFEFSRSPRKERETESFSRKWIIADVVRETMIVETSSASKKIRQWYKREENSQEWSSKHNNANKQNKCNELKVPSREFFREPSLFFARASTRRKVAEIRILFESEDRSYFLYFKTRNSTSSTLYASRREHTYLHLSTSVSYVRIKDISAFRVNNLIAVTCVEFPFFFTVEILQKQKVLKSVLWRWWCNVIVIYIENSHRPRMIRNSCFLDSHRGTRHIPRCRAVVPRRRPRDLFCFIAPFNFQTFRRGFQWSLSKLIERRNC